MTLNPQQLAKLRRTPVAGWNKVALAIEMLDLTMVEVSRGTGFPYTYVSDVKACRFETITIHNAHRFAKFFGCLVDDLFPELEVAA